MWLFLKRRPYPSVSSALEKQKLQLELLRSSQRSNQCIVGWRAWYWTDTPQGVYLRSVTAGTHWPHYIAMTGNLANGHGIYAYKLCPDALAYFQGIVGVFGSVNLWGQVAEHESGYRAEYAYPKELWVSPQTDPTVIIKLEEGYGIPVKEHESLKRVPQTVPQIANSLPQQYLSLGQISTISGLGTLGGLLPGGFIQR